MEEVWGYFQRSEYDQPPPSGCCLSLFAKPSPLEKLNKHLNDPKKSDEEKLAKIFKYRDSLKIPDEIKAVIHNKLKEYGFSQKSEAVAVAVPVR